MQLIQVILKTQILLDPLNFIFSTERVKKYIKDFEAPPLEYVILQTDIRVISYSKSIMRVLINFRDLKDNESPEDVLIDVQGTDKTNFKIIGIKKIKMK